MRVLTLDEDDFSKVCIQLGGQVREDSWQPDLIIGVATGGIYVADNIRNNVFPSLPLAYVKCQRPSTKLKTESGFKNILKKLPNGVNNILRLLESFFHENLNRFNRNIVKRELFLDDETRILIENSRNILLVDDAIDSGETIRTIVDELTTINMNLTVKVAVITITWNKPSIRPDFYIYNKVLIRFPWSLDAKK